MNMMKMQLSEHDDLVNRRHTIVVVPQTTTFISDFLGAVIQETLMTRLQKLQLTYGRKTMMRDHMLEMKLRKYDGKYSERAYWSRRRREWVEAGNCGCSFRQDGDYLNSRMQLRRELSK